MMVSIKKLYQTSSVKEASLIGSVKSMINQMRDLEALKIVKERKCESLIGSCLSDQSIVRIL